MKVKALYPFHFSLFQKIFLTNVGMFFGTGILVLLLYFSLEGTGLFDRAMERYVPAVVEAYEQRGDGGYFQEVCEVAASGRLLIQILDRGVSGAPDSDQLRQAFEGSEVAGRSRILPYITEKGRYWVVLMAIGDWRPRGAYDWFEALAVFSLFLAVACGCSWMLARHFVLPLARLSGEVQKLTDGELEPLSFDTKVDRNDEIGRLERNFLSMALHLHQAAEDRQRMIADISHDFRSPLARIQVATDLLTLKVPQSQELAERIQAEIKRLDGMISAMLDLGNGELYRDIQPRLLDLEPLLQAMAEEAGFEASWKGRSVTFQSQGPCRVRAVEHSLRSAVENLFRNALRYTHEGSQIVLRLVNHDGRHCRIILEDDGPGVDDSELKAIFYPFYRSDRARNQNSGGSGLGLAIVWKMVNLNGGTVWAENRQEGGLRVIIELPLDSLR